MRRISRTGLTLAQPSKLEEDAMNKYLLSPIVLVLVGLVSGCTTEKHYDTPPQTIIHEDRSSAADTHAGTREAAREGARDGARDPYR